MRNAVSEMTESALALADNIIGQAPDRPVTADEIQRIEDFVSDVVVKGARAERGRASDYDEPALALFRERFGKRLRMQAAFKAVPHGGTA